MRLLSKHFTWPIAIITIRRSLGGRNRDLGIAPLFSEVRCQPVFGHFRRGLLLAMIAAISLCWGRVVTADEGELISHGMTPYSDTWDEMVAREPYSPPPSLPF